MATSDHVRVIIRMDREAHYRKARLSNPDRAYFDILNARLSRNLLDNVFPVADKLLQQIRVNQNRPGVVRVVLDIAKSAEVGISELRDPFSIVIDIRAGEGAKSGKLPRPGLDASPKRFPVAPPPAAVENSSNPGVVRHRDDTNGIKSPTTRAADSLERDKIKSSLVESAQPPAGPTEAGTNAGMAGAESTHQPEVPGKTTSPVVHNREADKAAAVIPASNVPSSSSPLRPEAEPSKTRESQSSARKQLAAIHGQLRNETAYRVAKPGAFSKIKNLAYLEMNGKLSQHFGYNLSTRVYYDAVFDLNNAFGEKVRHDQQWDAELRNAFVDFSLGPMDLRLGKQQIVWGQAVNLFFADVVNPRDLREFVLRDLDDIRIPVWAGDLEFTFGNTHMEFVAIPVLDHDKIGVLGSDFSPSIPSLPENATLNIGDIRMPANNLRNGVYGFRLSQMVKGWDLGGFYLYGYDYTPTFFRKIDVNPDTQAITVNVFPEMTRKRTVGATFSKDFSGVVLKGEFVYDRERNFVVTDPSDADGIVKSDYFEYLFGVDYTFFRKVDFNFQFFQQYILKPVDTLYRADRGSFVSAWFKTGFFHNRLEPEVFAVSRLTDTGKGGDFMLRPKLNFNLGSHLRSALGADFFGGEFNGIFGQFNDSDRIYIEMRCLF